MGCKVLHVDGPDIDSGAIIEAASVVDGGGLVAFPTETVYGIGARVRSDSLVRLDDVKMRDSSKPYTVHIGRADDVVRYVPFIGAKVGKVIKNAWPGPLTIVFELRAEELEQQRMALGDEVFGRLYHGNSIGVRCPDNAVASALLNASRYPVVASSANSGDDPPAIDGSEALARVGGQVDLILDGGACKYGKSSTVAVVNNRGVTILRGGIYSEAELKGYSQINILFVCTGNTCRSPMAEGIFKKYLAENLGCAVDELGEMGYKVSSAGLLDMQGSAASSESVVACAAKGVDIGSHRSRPLSAELIAESDFIFAMEQMHRARVVALWADSADKCFLLAERNISDPIGQPQAVYSECADIIEEAVKKRIGELIV